MNDDKEIKIVESEEEEQGEIEVPTEPISQLLEDEEDEEDSEEDEQDEIEVPAEPISQILEDEEDEEDSNYQKQREEEDNREANLKQQKEQEKERIKAQKEQEKYLQQLEKEKVRSNKAKINSDSDLYSEEGTEIKGKNKLCFLGAWRLWCGAVG